MEQVHFYHQQPSLRDPNVEPVTIKSSAAVELFLECKWETVMREKHYVLNDEGLPILVETNRQSAEENIIIVQAGEEKKEEEESWWKQIEEEERRTKEEERQQKNKEREIRNAEIRRKKAFAEFFMKLNQVEILKYDRMEEEEKRLKDDKEARQNEEERRKASCSSTSA